MTRPNPLLAAFLHHAARTSAAAVEGLNQATAKPKKGRGEPTCTPCAAMARRRAAALHIQKLSGK